MSNLNERFETDLLNRDMLFYWFCGMVSAFCIGLLFGFLIWGYR